MKYSITIYSSLSTPQREEASSHGNSRGFTKGGGRSPIPRRARNLKSPWYLAAVCTRWRAICLESPRLWTTFEVGSVHQCKLIAGICVKFHPEVVRCYLQLQRSQAFPIDIVTEYGEDSCTDPVLRVLGKHSGRWGTLRFAPSHDLSPEFFSGLLRPPVHFSALRHLDHECTDGFFALGPHFDRQTLPALDSLRLADWRGDMQTALGGEHTLPNFPWFQLRRICLERYTGSSLSILHLLQASPNVTHFFLASNEITPPRGSTLQYSGPLALPELVHLEISLYRDRTATDAFEMGDRFTLLQLIPLLRTPKL